MQFVFATNNKNKLAEIQQLLTNKNIKILNLKDIGFEGDLPEEGRTIEANASQKANHIYEKYGYNCFADDSGLEIDALGGRPGVYSARYAGNVRSDFENVRKVLWEMNGQVNRRARFKTVIALINNGVERHFEGVVYGTITEAPRGSGGFGYDPVFQPEGYDKTFAEMSMEEKNRISHRAKAVSQLTEFLSGIK